MWLRTRLIAALTIALHTALPAQDHHSAAPDIQVQFGDLLFADGRFADAADAYRRALDAQDPATAVRAGVGLVLAHLRRGEFSEAFAAADTLRRAHPESASAAAVQGDALWSSGLFDEAEAAYESALNAEAGHARARHGRARALAARNRPAEALAEAQEALRLDPREAEFHHTLGSIHERLRSFDQAAAAYSNYVNLLPNRDKSEKAAWARSVIRFLSSFKDNRPFDRGNAPLDRIWRVPIRIEREKVLVRGRVNGGSAEDFILDTGAEQTVISRDLARKRGVVPITYIQSAGVGDVGMRGLQVGRIERLEIGDLEVRNVPCLIKNPPLSGLPGREPDSFSPLALGLSMRVDYQRRELVMGERLNVPARYDVELPLRLHRLAMVRGTVNNTHPATFIVDTGGEVISISTSTAGIIQPVAAFRRIPLKVYGTSGWDKDAFLMPNVDLAFSSIRFTRIPVVVLNLRAPSALLGFQLGGIVGHKFLSQYRVTIDVQRSVLGLERH
jgi:Flp pilus assembly protein TadD/predicted aspartyl protease